MVLLTQQAIRETTKALAISSVDQTRLISFLRRMYPYVTFYTRETEDRRKEIVGVNGRLNDSRDSLSEDICQSVLDYFN